MFAPAEPERPVDDAGLLFPCEVLDAVHRRVREQPPGACVETPRADIRAGEVGEVAACFTGRQSAHGVSA